MHTIQDQPSEGSPRRRRFHSDEFKAVAVAAAAQPGVSLAAVAMAHGINANLLFKWRRRYRAGWFGEPRPTHHAAPQSHVSEGPRLLPVMTVSPPSGLLQETKCVTPAAALEIVIGGATVRVLGEIIVAVLAVKGVAAVAALGGALAVLKAAFMRFLPVLAAVAVWEMGRGIVNMVQDIRETNRAIDEMNRQRQQLEQLTAAMEELANTGTLSVKTQMMLAAQAAERLKAALPGTADALRAILN